MAEAAAVTEICQRLDGIPLAIELAASRMASMTASEMRDRLDHRFRLLVGSRRGLERHQTLRHAVAWSYELLNDAEKGLLTRCSVFAGGFNLQSASAVAGSDDLDEYAVLDLLGSLVRKSLLVADRSGGRTRFSMDSGRPILFGHHSRQRHKSHTRCPWVARSLRPAATNPLQEGKDDIRESRNFVSEMARRYEDIADQR